MKILKMLYEICEELEFSVGDISYKVSLLPQAGMINYTFYTGSICQSLVFTVQLLEDSTFDIVEACKEKLKRKLKVLIELEDY